MVDILPMWQRLTVRRHHAVLGVATEQAFAIRLTDVVFARDPLFVAVCPSVTPYVLIITSNNQILLWLCDICKKNQQVMLIWVFFRQKHTVCLHALPLSESFQRSYDI